MAISLKHSPDDAVKLPDENREQAKGEGVKSVELALDILEAVQASRKSIGVSSIAKAIGVSKPSVFRHLQTLTGRGYLRKDSNRPTYRLGPAAELLTRSSLSAALLVSASREIVKDLADDVALTAVLSLVTNEGIIVMDKQLGPRSLEIGVRAGSCLPIHASAQGKVAAAFSPALLGLLRDEGLVEMTKFTILEEAQLAEDLQQARLQGWAVAPEEMTLGINALAAPIFDGHKRCVATIAIVGSIQYIQHMPDAKLIERVLNAADAISRKILSYCEADRYRMTT